jgi:large subunit ribosomal protein L24
LTSTKPRVQRLIGSSREKAASLMRSPLSKDLSSEYGFGTISVRKGDTVIVTRGDYKGHEGKISSVVPSRLKITIEGVSTKKQDGTTKPVFISTSKVKVTKLELSDKRRKNILEERSRSKKSK